MPDNPHVKDNPPVLGEEIFLFNDEATPEDVAHNRPVNQAVGLSLSTGSNEAKWVSDETPIPMREAGQYGYRAGTVPATVDVPAQAFLQRVSVLASDVAGATITIGGGDVITVVAGGAFDEKIPGKAQGADVVIAGSIQAYYVSWVA